MIFTRSLSFLDIHGSLNPGNLNFGFLDLEIFDSFFIFLEIDEKISLAYKIEKKINILNNK